MVTEQYTFYPQNSISISDQTAFNEQVSNSFPELKVSENVVARI